MTLIKRLLGRKEQQEQGMLPRARKLIKKGYQGLYSWSEEEALNLVEYLSKNHPNCFKNPKELAGIAMAETCYGMEVGSLAFTGEDTSKCSAEDWKRFHEGCRDRAIKHGASRVFGSSGYGGASHKTLESLYDNLKDKRVFSNYYDWKREQREIEEEK